MFAQPVDKYIIRRDWVHVGDVMCKMIWHFDNVLYSSAEVTLRYVVGCYQGMVYILVSRQDAGSHSCYDARYIVPLSYTD